MKCFNLTNISAIHISSTFHSPLIHSPFAMRLPSCSHPTTISIYYGRCVSGFWVLAVNIYVSQRVALALDGTYSIQVYMYICMQVCLHVRYLFRCFVAFYDTINIIVCVIYGFRAIGPTVPCPLGHLRDIRSSPLHLNSDVFAFIY